MIFIFVHLLLNVLASCASPRLFSDAQFGKFISNEFNYSYYLEAADLASGKLVPFQDKSNDTFFRVGIVHKNQLENYTKIQLEDQLGDIANKPWLPTQQIQEEFVNCLKYKYGSLSENDFKYDNGLYGWFHVMKFSCAEVHEGFYVFVMAFSRTRFRLKQVYLRRQNRYWTTSGRTIISRDVQKIVDMFCIQYAIFARSKLEDELRTLTSRLKDRNQQIRGTFIRLPEELAMKMEELFPSLLSHLSSSLSRKRTFGTISIPVRTRILIARNDDIEDIVENLSTELTDESCYHLTTCSKLSCSHTSELLESFSKKNDTRQFGLERTLSYKYSEVDTFIAYQTARPFFVFGKSQRKTSHGIVDIEQKWDDEAMYIWKSLLDQQLALSIRMHSQAFFPNHRDPYSSPETSDERMDQFEAQ